MKYLNWNSEKNELLKKERGISFEIMAFQIEVGNILDVIDHPNQDKYPGLRIFVIEFEEYAYFVPFVENDDEVFLKTIIPSRKGTKDYLK
ncbi:MAG: toxin [Candidatus Marinimicrobia bacterium]|nr:toxin [Candidatus Neomarinimicrobiota bacterium]